MVEWETDVPEGGDGICWSESSSSGSINGLLTILQPVILAMFYLALKIRNRRLWVELHPVYTGPIGLAEVLNRLERNAHSEVQTEMVAEELDDMGGDSREIERSSG